MACPPFIAPRSECMPVGPVRYYPNCKLPFLTATTKCGLLEPFWSVFPKLGRFGAPSHLSGLKIFRKTLIASPVGCKPNASRVMMSVRDLEGWHIHAAAQLAAILVDEAEGPTDKGTSEVFRVLRVLRILRVGVSYSVLVTFVKSVVMVRTSNSIGSSLVRARIRESLEHLTRPYSARQPRDILRMVLHSGNIVRAGAADAGLQQVRSTKYDAYRFPSGSWWLHSKHLTFITRLCARNLYEYELQEKDAEYILDPVSHLFPCGLLGTLTEYASYLPPYLKGRKGVKELRGPPQIYSVDEP